MRNSTTFNCIFDDFKNEAYDNLGINSSLSKLHTNIVNTAEVDAIVSQYKPTFESSDKSSHEENKLEKYIPLSVFAPYFTGIRKLDERYEIEIDLWNPVDDGFRFLIKTTTAADCPKIDSEQLHFLHNTVELDLVGK